VAESLRMPSVDQAFKCAIRGTLPWHLGFIVIQVSGRKNAASHS
jgi:hypothetical protein